MAQSSIQTKLRAKFITLLLIPMSAIILGSFWTMHNLPMQSTVAVLLGLSNKSTSFLITKEYDCSHEYSIEIMSLDPVVLYLNNFLKESEIQHLLELTKDDFSDSFVYLPNGTSVIDRRYRTPKSAMVPSKDPVGRCLDQRMKSMLGNVQHEDTEQLQLVKYSEGERFLLHNDWLQEPLYRKVRAGKPPRAFNGLASIFSYLEDDCTSGETYFPNITSVTATADGEKFSRSSTGQGLLVRPRRGNAVFWNNVNMNGTGDERMDHASLPVHSGTKIGMNMFGLYFLDSPIVGGQQFMTDDLEA